MQTGFGDVRTFRYIQIGRIECANGVDAFDLGGIGELLPPQLLDSFPAELNYCLHLLIGFGCVEIDHGGRLSAMGGVGSLVVVEGDSSTNACLGL